MKHIAFVGAFVSAIIIARNPFIYEQNAETSDTPCIADGAYDGARVELVRNAAGDLTLMIEKIPSTLGKAEGLGG